MTTPTIRVRRSADRFRTAGSGLTSRHAFSFGPHYDPAEISYGPLLASNDDVVEVSRGYDDHPHRDVEIVTWVVSGSLVHADSFGNSGLIYPGLVQRMTAGTGIVHSERNDAYAVLPDHPPEPVHFVQMWLRPDRAGSVPGYAQAEWEPAAAERDWLPVVSGRHPDAPVRIGTEAATLWVRRAGAGEQVTVPAGPQVYLQLTGGAVDLDPAGPLATGDAARGDGGGWAAQVTSDTELLVWTFDDGWAA